MMIGGGTYWAELAVAHPLFAPVCKPYILPAHFAADPYSFFSLEQVFWSSITHTLLHKM
jgi:hypothetical protein